MTEHFFNCQGTIDVQECSEPIVGALHNTIGFSLPDGTTVDLAICIRVIDPDGNEKYITDESLFHLYGLTNLSYETAEFQETTLANSY